VRDRLLKIRTGLILSLAITLTGLLTLARPGTAQTTDAKPDESALGTLVITGTSLEKLPRLAVLPSLSPDLEDVIVRGVVRRDFELTGLFEVITDAKAPPGLYGFEDPVDIDAWRKLGAEAIVKVAARTHAGKKDEIEVFGLAYFLNVGKDPVYEKKLVVTKDAARVTAHRITDALLGALTGRPGSFASHFTFSGKWGRNRRTFTMESDGHALEPRTDANDTAIAPTFGPNGDVFFSLSHNYSPFRLMQLGSNGSAALAQLPFRSSVYSSAFDREHKRLAVAIAESTGSSIYVGNADGSDMKKVSSSKISTHPVFSPTGKLAWIGGTGQHGTQRVYVDGKPVSPSGFTAAAPTFCDTEDGVFLVYSVQVGGDREDLVMSRQDGKGISRLTQNQGSNTFPACSPDGRLLAFFSTRGKDPAMYLMSLRRWTTQRLAGQYGESLRWAPLPP
jgi:TolB protein